MLMRHYGSELRKQLSRSGVVPFIGVYDTFSASLAGQDFDNIFVSGLSFAASYYGLPDIGFIRITSYNVCYTKLLRVCLEL